MNNSNANKPSSNLLSTRNALAQRYNRDQSSVSSLDSLLSEDGMSLRLAIVSDGYRQLSSPTAPRPRRSTQRLNLVEVLDEAIAISSGFESFSRERQERQQEQ